MARILLEGISKRFGDTVALKSLDLEVQEGEFLSLLGPSGCGKTTTLRIIAGLERPTTGEVYFDDRPVTALPPAERRIAMVFQLNALYPYMTVWENIAFPLRAQRLSRGEIRRRVESVAEMLGISSLLGLPAAQVHAADGQRVAIAKAIASEPSAFLLDEPFSHLDAPMRARMRAELKHLHETVGRTMLFVTHDQAEALALSDRIAVMRQGELVQLGTPEEVFHRPTDRYVAEFIGTPPINLFSVTLQAEGDRLWGVVPSGGRFRLPDSWRRLGLPIQVLLGIRPRRVRLHPSPAGTPGDRRLLGTVEVLEPMGRERLHHVRVGENLEVRAMLPQDRSFSEGSSVLLELPPEHLLVFDPVSGRRIEEKGER
ncbi:MAG: ABC transporter ATP-binding protein [Candidatus Poribacteria bacterium]|nr:MAG: ABC transporter ATP-binding protein [Candidatus Poribacteria bacterium]